MYGWRDVDRGYAAGGTGRVQVARRWWAMWILVMLKIVIQGDIRTGNLSGSKECCPDNNRDAYFCCGVYIFGKVVFIDVVKNTTWNKGGITGEYWYMLYKIQHIFGRRALIF